MKATEAQLALEKIAKEQNLEIGEKSHYEKGYGSKYITAKPFTVAIHSADARCGNRSAVCLHLPKGSLQPLTGYFTPAKLKAEILKSDFRAEITKYKTLYK